VAVTGIVDRPAAIIAGPAAYVLAGVLRGSLRHWLSLQRLRR